MESVVTPLFEIDNFSPTEKIDFDRISTVPFFFNLLNVLSGVERTLATFFSYYMNC